MFKNNSSNNDDFDSLIQDMLKDLADSPIREDDRGMHEALSALEHQLMPAASSVGAFVVQSSHRPPLPNLTTADSAPVNAPAQLPTHSSSADAWLQSLTHFESMQLADDFVRADVAKKEGNASSEALQFMEDYDVNEPLVYAAVQQQQSSNRMNQGESLAIPIQQPPPAMLMQQPPSSSMTAVMPFPPMIMAPMHHPPHGMLRPVVSSHPPSSFAPTPMYPPMVHKTSFPIPPPPPPPSMNADFPPLSTAFTHPTPILTKSNKEPLTPHSVQIPTVRLFFHDTSPSARPIPAAQIPTAWMTPRDICFVIHSMLKPVLSFASVLDMYNADYYKWGYDQRIQARQGLFIHPIVTPPMSSSSSALPTPVWKETKQTAKDMEQQYLSMVQVRAEEWNREKQNLGKLVKVDVKRPRALLASSSLVLNNKTREESLDENTEEEEQVQHVQQDVEEEIQRTSLWKARIAIDQGYQAYLNLIELRRLLQTRGKEDVFLLSSSSSLSQEESKDETSLADNPDSRRRLELLMDVETQVQKLHTALGFSYKKQETPSNPQASSMELNQQVLTQTLALPKGKILVSRIVDEGILPHGSACIVLPKVLRIVLYSYHGKQSIAASYTTKPSSSSSSSMYEDDRMLGSLTGLVRLIHPSPWPQTLIDCLDVVNTFSKHVKQDDKTPIDIKLLLSNHPKLLELLHAILNRGMDVCGKAGEVYINVWKSKEKEFIDILTTSVE